MDDSFIAVITNVMEIIIKILFIGPENYALIRERRAGPLTFTFCFFPSYLSS